MPEPVDVTTEDRVTTVTLNRPAARNAINRALLHALWDAVAAADADAGVDVVILTGADPAFCAGVDFTEISEPAPTPPGPPAPTPPAQPAPARLAQPARPVPPPPGTGPGRDTNGLFRFLPLIGKPVIGAINGPAVTGGLEIALQCTFLIASDRASFADTHARLGVMPGGGMTVLLAQSVGLRRAIEMSLTGNRMTADEALRAGLVNHVVPHDELLPYTRRLAADLVSSDQAAVRQLLRHYRQVAAAATLGEAHLIEGYLAETWQPGTSLVAGRRTAVTARGRSSR
jgi:enoyl-CoA hydratase